MATVLSGTALSNDLAIIRSRDTHIDVFRAAVHRIGLHIASETLKYLPAKPERVTTPLETTTVDVIADVTTTTQPEQTTTTTQPVQESTWSTLPDTPDFQSATLVRGGAIGKGLKPTRLISNGLREGVTPAQQRMAVTAAVMIAIPSPITVSRRKT